MREVVKVLLSLTRWQRFTIIGLALICIVVNVLVLSGNAETPLPNYAIEIHNLDSLSSLEKEKYTAYTHFKKNNTKQSSFENMPIEVEYFMFNPNNLNIEEWQRLGVQKNIAQRLVNYVGKGGHFYTKQDLKNFYSLPPELYQKLEPYINIEQKQKEILQLNNFTVAKKIILVDVNSNQVEAWSALKGIGEKLSQRIIKYKNRLGGFYSINQVAEVWGISDTLFEQIKPHLILNNPQLVKINLNTVTEEELKTHPYIQFKLAKMIIAYREQHTNFKNIDELKEIKILDIATFEKIKPYLTLN